MTAAARRERDQAHRRARIVASARAMAEADGWDKVTTRRLADAIEYSQPVLYGHFSDGKPQIMTAVALEGFAEVADAMSNYSPRAGARTRLRAVVDAYLIFAEQNPAVYEAMFSRPLTERFAEDGSAKELKAAFDAIEAVVPAGVAPRDRETAAELLWSSLHGLATLGRGDRLRPAERDRRAALLVELLLR